MHRLFTSASGEPLSTSYPEFFLCGVPPSISTEIRTHGGIVSILNSHDSVFLVSNAPNSVTAERFDRPVYSAAFVQQSIQAGKLLEIADFAVLADCPPSGKGRKRAKLRQIDINQLVRYASRHPPHKDESSGQYWDRVGREMAFGCSSAVLQKEYDRHLRRLLAQGFCLQEVRKRPKVTTEFTHADTKSPISVRVFVPFRKPTCPPERTVPAVLPDPPLYQTEGSLIVARFEALVRTCQRLCQAEVTATEVLRTLIRHRGSSIQTIQEFKDTQ